MTEPSLRKEVGQPRSRPAVPALVMAYVTALVAALATSALVLTQVALDPQDAPVAATYYVQPDDNLSAIAHRLHARGGVQALIDANRLARPDALTPGQRLFVVAPPSRLVGLQKPFANPIQPAETCAVAPLPRTETIPQLRDPDCFEQRCVFADDGARVCHCWSDKSALVITTPGHKALRVPVDTDISSARLQAGRLDLDGDGARELIAAVYITTSNGIALSYYTIVIVDGRHPNHYLSFGTIGWGTAARAASRDDDPRLDSLLLRSHGRCMVAPESFESLRDPVLGEGNYLVQRLFPYRDGRLELQRPVDLRALRLHPAARLQRWPGAKPAWPEEYVAHTR